jgi:hypothetical protein
MSIVTRRTVSRQPVNDPSQGRPLRPVVLLSLNTTLATWHGSPFAVLLTIALSSLTIILFAMAQRALHIASTTIEKILQEELDMHGVHADHDVATEKEQSETGTMT